MRDIRRQTAVQLRIKLHIHHLLVLIPRTGSVYAVDPVGGDAFRSAPPLALSESGTVALRAPSQL